MSKVASPGFFNILYADDLILVSDSVEGLQTLLDGLFSFCKKWHMIVYLTKTKIMVFNKRKLKDIKFVYNGNEVEVNCRIPHHNYNTALI